jgi:hypothetical protein
VSTISLRFRDRLLATIPVLIASDYQDARQLIEQFPDLVACISYVTARYIPGYSDLRQLLMPMVTKFLQSAVGRYGQRPKEDMATMQALIILYVFSRSSAVENNSESPFIDELNFWSIKATCETFATLINLHMTADAIKRGLDKGRVLKRTDADIRKYLYWLWLYTTAHK